MSQKKVLFVCYGSGHVRMVVPVAKALQASGLAHPVVLGLTTAAAVVRAAGLDLLQFKDFLRSGDEIALAHGRRLMAGMGRVDDLDETTAYLGLCYAELEQDVGAGEAGSRYAQNGRQAFLPLRVLQRIVAQVAPDLVFATNSPRAERAAIEAARTLGLPAICLVDLFCRDEVKWIGAPGYADQVCVLNPSVREFLISAGRAAHEVMVTGNPAFEALADPANIAAGRLMRQDRYWGNRRVLLWPTQMEPAFHPFNGKPGHPELPGQALEQVINWVIRHEDSVLCVRPRAGEVVPALPDHPRILVMGQEVSLPVLLHAINLVVTLNSTVGLEGHLAGARLVQVLGSVFDDAMPLALYGIADEAVPVGNIAAALDRHAGKARLARGTGVGIQEKASDEVLKVIRRFL